MKRALMVLLSLCLFCPGLAEAAPPAQRVYALVVKDVTNPYMRRMFEGFEDACAGLDVTATLSGPGDASALGQVACVEALIEAKVDAIAVAANDKNTLSPALQKAIAAGIQVVSLDSDVNPEDRMVHIQQASPEVIGRVLMQAAHEMLGGEGEFAILTTTKYASNQALWVSWMHREIEENPETYAKMPLAVTLYGRDLYADSYSLTERLLRENPNVRLIIAPTSVGILAAATAIRDANASVRVTGLGLPSDMADFIRSGLCPWMYLWNPIDVGYVAAYAADALVGGAITGDVGEVLPAGKCGILKATRAADGGSEIVVGNPYMFDDSNVAVWEEIF